MLSRLPRPWLSAACLGALLLASRPARAEDGEGPEDPRAKVRKQMEKILKLMRDNEQALLEASTLGGTQPKGPDVPVPPTPPSPQGSGSGGQGQGGQGQGGQGQGGQGQGGQGQGGQGQGQGGASGGSPQGSGGGAGGAQGEEIRRKLDELSKGQAGASSIPEELQRLVDMIPTQQGGGGGQGEGKPQSGGSKEQETPEARAARERKELEEQQRKEQAGGKDPKEGRKDPNDASGRPPGDPDAPKPDVQPDPNLRAWLTGLPPELREFVAGGGLEKLPPRARVIIEAYLRSLHRQTGPSSDRRR